MSARCGLSSNARQIRPIVDFDSPERSAIFDRDQCVAFSGVDSKRRDDHILDLLGGDRRRAPRPRIIRQPIQPQLTKPLAPLPDRRRRHPHSCSDILV